MIRRVLVEGVTDDLAAMRSGNTLTLYRPEVLKSGGSSEDATVGYLQVKPAPDCGDAWELVEVWGPGYGDLLVSLAFAMVPSGKLIVDRQVVTPAGAKMWKRTTSAIEKEPLPSTCTTRHQKSGDEALNMIYVSSGDPGTLNTLLVRHADVMDELSEKLDVPPKQLERGIMGSGWDQFNASLPLR